MAERFGMLMPAFRLAACFLRTARFFLLKRRYGRTPRSYESMLSSWNRYRFHYSKVAVIDDNNKILFADYERHYANIQETLASLLKKCKGELGELSLRPNITGSGGLTLSGYLHIPFVQEVVAVATALQDYAPRTDVAIELGGEDAKIIYLQAGSTSV